MADFAKILEALRKEETQLAKRATQVRSAIKALSEVPIPLGKQKAGKKAATKKRAPRKMTAAQKKAIGQRMKASWVKRKKEAKKKSTKS